MGAEARERYGSTVSVAHFVRARDRLLAADRAELGPTQVCEEVVRAFHDLAEFDRAAFLTTDPDTLLPAGGVVEGFPIEACGPTWDNELLDPDFNKYAPLARSHDPVATLAEATEGELDRSPRYRKIFEDLGVADELRVACVAGSTCLAIGSFTRPFHSGAFGREEVDGARRLVPVATTVLRRALGRVTEAAENEPPVMIVVGADERITASTPGADRVLEALRVKPDQDGRLPHIVRAAVVKARWGRTSTTLSTRLRDANGTLLRLHVTPLEGQVGAVALLVERAHPNDVARVLLDSYGLTHRETDIVLALARGLSAKEIAAELALSPHTVRDHVKVVYEKTGVNSRGELVANIFSNHVAHRLHNAVERLD